MYKKLTACLLVALLLLASLPALGQAGERQLVVANPTKLSGSFFTDRWGNNSADLDVRQLLHGLGTVAHRGDGSLVINSTVVKQHQRVADAAGNLTYTFTLWDDLKFSDGSPITARDYAASVLLLAGKPLHALSQADSRSYEHMLGYQAYFSGQSAALAGLRLMDEHSFSLTIDAAQLPYYYELSLVEVIPYPKALLLPDAEFKDEGQGLGFAEALDNDKLKEALFGEQGYVSQPTVTSGPYRLISYDRALGEAQFELNPWYKGDHQGRKPGIQSIKLVEATNEGMVDQLLDGKMDIINKITWQQAVRRARQQAARKNIQVQEYGRRGLAFLAYTCDQGPTASLPLRRAIASLVSRPRLIERGLGAYGSPVYGYYGQGQDLVQGQEQALKKLLNIYPYSLREAEKLLIADGWAYNKDGKQLRTARGAQRYRMEGDELIPLTLRMAITQDNPIAEELAKHLAANLQRVGVQLEVSRLDTVAFFRQYYRQDERAYDLMFLGSNFGLVFDPYHSLLPLTGGQGEQNSTGIHDPELLKLSDSLRRTQPGDSLSYLLHWQRFQQRFVDQLPLLPLYSNTYYDAFTNDLINYRPDQYGSWAQAILYASWK